MLLKANRTVILVTQQLNLLQQAHNVSEEAFFFLIFLFLINFSAVWCKHWKKISFERNFLCSKYLIIAMRVEWCCNKMCSFEGKRLNCHFLLFGELIKVAAFFGHILISYFQPLEVQMLQILILLSPHIEHNLVDKPKRWRIKLAIDSNSGRETFLSVHALMWTERKYSHAWINWPLWTESWMKSIQKQ